MWGGYKWARTGGRGVLYVIEIDPLSSEKKGRRVQNLGDSMFTPPPPRTSVISPSACGQLDHENRGNHGLIIWFGVRSVSK